MKLFNNPLLTLALIGIVIILLFLNIQGCNKRNNLEKQHSNLLTALADTVEKFKNKEGDYVSRISTLQTERAQDFIDLETKDKEIKKLQGVVDDYKKKLKAPGSSVTNTTTTTKIDTSGKTKVVKEDSVKKENIVYIYPTYSYGFKNKWVDYQGTMNKDTSFFKLKIHNEFSTIVGKDKGRPFTDVITYNPYSSTDTVRTYQTLLPKPKQWTISIVGGYGGTLYNTQIVTGPFIGIAVGKTILRL